MREEEKMYGGTNNLTVEHSVVSANMYLVSANEFPHKEGHYSNRIICGRLLGGLYLKKNQNAPRHSEHPPVRGEKCQNV